MKNLTLLTFVACASAVAVSCSQSPKKSRFDGSAGEVKLMTLDPGHFHAALVQKNMYPQVDPDVYVFAPEGEDVQMHLGRIENYNTRQENPTTWNEIVYTGPDFYEKMIAEKPGNVLVLAGNNGKKTDYIKGAVEAGINVLSDKPMAIDAANYRKLEEAFAAAQKNGVLLYDIMTERYEVTNALQRELANIPELFGELQKGTPEDPAITKESVHHFFKYVSGQPLTRPQWYFDVEQQGEGIVDVTTHLVDLVQLAVVGEKPIDPARQIELTGAKRWATPLSKEQYQLVSGKQTYPDFLTKDVENDTLKVYANGEIDYKLDGVNVRVVVLWNFMAPEGAGDTHYSVMKGSNADVMIRQGAEQGYKPMLYVAKKSGVSDEEFEKTLNESIAKLAGEYPGLEIARAGEEWQVVIPEKYYVGHEAHFGQVTEKYLQYLVEGKLPEWEIANMKAKYYTTTKALEMAKAAGETK